MVLASELHLFTSRKQTGSEFSDADHDVIGVSLLAGITRIYGFALEFVLKMEEVSRWRGSGFQHYSMHFFFIFSKINSFC